MLGVLNPLTSSLSLGSTASKEPTGPRVVIVEPEDVHKVSGRRSDSISDLPDSATLVAAPNSIATFLPSPSPTPSPAPSQVPPKDNLDGSSSDSDSEDSWSEVDDEEERMCVPDGEIPTLDQNGKPKLKLDTNGNPLPVSQQGPVPRVYTDKHGQKRIHRPAPVWPSEKAATVRDPSEIFCKTLADPIWLIVYIEQAAYKSCYRS